MPREDTEDLPKPTAAELQEELGLENPFDENDSTRVRPITSDTDPLIGVEAGEYRILAPLGAGSMGLVYKGAHQSTGRVVAIKVLKRALISDPTHARRFLDEARAVAACNHAGIIDVFSVGQLASDEPYLVMEFLEGEPLDAKLAREERLPVSEVLELGVALASALQAAHAVGVIHRDIKPPNIFIVQRPNGTRLPKLIDFGLAQRVQSGERQEQTSIGGTPLYLAPEQARKQPITPQADLYSFGCVLFELLSGKPPFTAGNLHALLDQHASLAPMPLRALVPEAPKSLEKLVLSMLAKAPDDRPASAAEVKKALEAVRAELAAFSPGAAGGARRGPPPEDEKTTVSFVHQPRANVATEPEGLGAISKPTEKLSPELLAELEAATSFDAKPSTERPRTSPPVPDEGAMTFDALLLSQRPPTAFRAPRPRGGDAPDLEARKATSTDEVSAVDAELGIARKRQAEGKADATPRRRTGEVPALSTETPRRQARLKTVDEVPDFDEARTRQAEPKMVGAERKPTGEVPAADAEARRRPAAPKTSEPRRRTGEVPVEEDAEARWRQAGLKPAEAEPRKVTGEQPALDAEGRRRLSESQTPDAEPHKRTGEVPAEDAEAAATRRRLEMKTLDTDADPASEPRPARRVTGELKADPAARGLKGSDTAVGTRPRTGEHRRAEPAATLVETDEGPSGTAVSDGALPEVAPGDELKSAPSRERKAARAMSQTGVPVAPATSSRLVPLVIAAAVVVALIAIAVLVKVLGSESVAPQPPPKPVVVPEPVVPPPPIAEAPVKPVEAPKANPATAKQVADKYKKLSTRFAALPKASRANAQEQLKALKGCSQPPETCLQQLEQLERKWFKK